MGDVLHVGYLSQVELTWVGKIAAVQDPHAQLRPCPCGDAGLCAYTSWVGSHCGLRSKSADIKLVYLELYFLNSSCFVL